MTRAAAAKATLLWRPASAIRTELEDAAPCADGVEGAAAIPCADEAGITLLALAELGELGREVSSVLCGTRPDSVSRFSRFRSARISDACW